VTKMFLADTMLWVCAALSAMTALAAHYLVERYDLWRRGITILFRYTLGVICIVGPFLPWALANGYAYPLAALLLLTTFAGAATLLAYLVDGTQLGQCRGADLNNAGLGDGQD
jgi:hypothetical protein